MTHPATTYHLVPVPVWEVHDASAEYTPEAFAEEGFIHTTHNLAELAAVANRYYRSDRRPYLALEIEMAHVRAPIKIEDPGGRYPHIYGPLNRDAIAGVREVMRDADGTFLGVRDA